MHGHHKRDASKTQIKSVGPTQLSPVIHHCVLYNYTEIGIDIGIPVDGPKSTIISNFLCVQITTWDPYFTYASTQDQFANSCRIEPATSRNRIYDSNPSPRDQTRH